MADGRADDDCVKQFAADHWVVLVPQLDEDVGDLWILRFANGHGKGRFVG